MPPLLAETCSKSLEIRQNPLTDMVGECLFLGRCDKSVGSVREEGLSNVAGIAFSGKYRGIDGQDIGWTRIAATAEGVTGRFKNRPVRVGSE